MDTDRAQAAAAHVHISDTDRACHIGRARWCALQLRRRPNCELLAVLLRATGFTGRSQVCMHASQRFYAAGAIMRCHASCSRPLRQHRVLPHATRTVARDPAAVQYMHSWVGQHRPCPAVWRAGLDGGHRVQHQIGGVKPVGGARSDRGEVVLARVCARPHGPDIEVRRAAGQSSASAVHVRPGLALGVGQYSQGAALQQKKRQSLIILLTFTLPGQHSGHAQVAVMAVAEPGKT